MEKTISEFIEERKNRKSKGVMPFGDKISLVYRILKRHLHWAYSVDELIQLTDSFRGKEFPLEAVFDRKTMKKIVKYLIEFDAIVSKTSDEENYYIFKQDKDVAELYRVARINGWNQFRMKPPANIEDLKGEKLNDEHKVVSS